MSDGNAHETRYLVELGRADPVGAALLFLNLLEGQAEALGQALLAHAQLLAAQTHAAIDVDIGSDLALRPPSPPHPPCARSWSRDG